MKVNLKSADELRALNLHERPYDTFHTVDINTFQSIIIVEFEDEPENEYHINLFEFMEVLDDDGISAGAIP